MELQVFLRDTDQADSWMAKQEVTKLQKNLFQLFLRGVQAFLGNQDVGDSLDGVEVLVKKHEDFEKSLLAQEEKVKAVDDVATRLLQTPHYAAEDIDQRRKEVCFVSARVNNSVCVCKREMNYTEHLIGPSSPQSTADSDRSQRGPVAGLPLSPAVPEGHRGGQ